MEPIQFARRNDKGFTLVEVMIAMLVLLIGLMGSLVGMMKAIEYNLAHDTRNEAIKIAQRQLDTIRNTIPANVIDGDWDPVSIQISGRKSQRTFNVTTTVWDNSVHNPGTLQFKLVTVTVQWNYKDLTRTYSAQTILRQ